MAYHYSDPRRQSESHALPNVETFEAFYCDEDSHEELCIHADGEACEQCKGCPVPFKGGWFWWSCFLGCLPDGEAQGPFATEADAVADAQADCVDDDTRSYGPHYRR